MRKTSLPELDEERRRAVRLDGTSAHESPLENDRAPIPPKADASSENGDTGEMEDECAAELISRGRKKSAREYAMTLVSSHSYTESALVRKLSEKERYTESEIAQAIEYVKGYGYINDARLASNSVPKLAGRLWGKKKICYYLKNKGISQDVIDSLDFSEIDFYENCKALALKNSAKAGPKLIRFLLNAGFSSEEVRYALSEDFDI